ncbi:phage major capsid protein [Mycobacteroides abscessus]|uniref:phage major capsid protein n=1 Tax=Mycobacteroides abscessus TaxID=36809 RepID=UPI000C25FF80|nr:phage major capsid protein [Mycobacteroides abscessus]MDM2493488.1 phage major capsid protein [Mycobacteroides abscessus]MDM2514434.1 phage major capsid protein [Mycobacteroides abscessus]MDM2523778.1 phage major capsid protein [Mycobacteroides abscessus]MDM2528201.1 phage major capsid protein [Mycobacteroides abscessus]MDM2531552.1 phage major capsid protein [Mycobacteroides abscessus]
MAIAIPSGNLSAIQSQLSQAIVAPLQERSTFLSLPGINIYDTAAPLRIPRAASTAPTAAFVAPGVQITDSNVALDELPLLPTERTSLKTLTKISNELIRQATLSLESVLTQRITMDQSLVLDAALWNGTGNTNTIKGILKAGGITTSVQANLLTDPDVLIDELAAMSERFVTPTVLVMRPTTYAALRKIKVGAADNRYVIDPSAAFATGTLQLLGLPVVLTVNVPANAVAILDTTHVHVARDTDNSVTILDQTFGDYDAIGIRTVSRYDVVIDAGAAVSLIKTS